MVAVMKALAFNQCGLGSISARFHMCVDFVVNSSLAPRVFSGLSSFPFTKTNTPKSNFTSIKDPQENQPTLM